ncbi:hypothetical protein BpHYR1_054066 [Brachionus plicatilis]|uniref:Uncharacterized protein n=1 Tax=Brachionus plicatilis TaxID=10195 RepID=A0A3M7RC24_BRAPC|nr:hypothetical protein BpHYR1_054066 [Brachionus plicatilis]
MLMFSFFFLIIKGVLNFKIDSGVLFRLDTKFKQIQFEFPFKNFQFFSFAGLIYSILISSLYYYLMAWIIFIYDYYQSY